MIVSDPAAAAVCDGAPEHCHLPPRRGLVLSPWLREFLHPVTEQHRDLFGVEFRFLECPNNWRRSSGTRGVNVRQQVGRRHRERVVQDSRECRLRKNRF